ncbi:glycoside hydrolase family 5 protein [Roseibium album]|uniref:glycoside hydrolase family 5 protein n=1 Tax=Roseibium album TaxID=311410 RepID=UPI003296B7BF
MFKPTSALPPSPPRLAAAIRPAFLFWFICALVQMPASAQATTCLRGVNIAGAEFGDPGSIHGQGYIYPSETTLDWAAQQEMTAIRLPFLWERLQPELFGNFDPAELARLQVTVQAANSRGLSVVLDLHNYAEYRGQRLGTGTVTSEALADFWRRLPPYFAGNDKVVFGLMNEPADITAKIWFEGAQAGLDAIRDSGADQLVLVPGTIWTGASHWFDEQDGGSNADHFRNISDKADNFAFEFHQYLDEDYSGTHASCPRTQDALSALEKVTDWMRDHDFKGFLGEFGGSQSEDCLEGLKDVAGYLNNNHDTWIGWTAWAAGDWWGDYPLSLQPSADGEKPQTVALKPFFNGFSGQCE